MRPISNYISAMGRAITIIVCITMLTGCTKKQEHHDQNAEVQVPHEADVATEFDAETLTLSDQHKSEVFFDHLNITVPLPNEHYIRSFGAVDNMKRRLVSLLDELGIEDENLRSANPAGNGLNMALRFRDGKSCSYIWVRKDDDVRITKSRLAHEECHVVEGLSQSASKSFHGELKIREPLVQWSEFDEEQRCSVVEVMSLVAQGMSLESVSGSELIVWARAALAKPEQ